MPSIDRERLQRWTFLLLFVLIAYLFWRVAEPLWVPLLLGGLIAIAMHPLHKKLLGRMKGKHRDAIAAAAITGGVLIVGLALVVFLCAVLFRQVLGMAYAFAQRTRQETPTQLLGPHLSDLLAKVGESPERLQRHVAAATSDLAGHLGGFATGVLSASAGAALVLVFTAITTYYLLRHGERFTNWMVMVLPLPDSEVWELVRNFRDVSRVMLLGTGVTAAYQGIASFIGYWVAGVPHPLVWATATAMASILPAVGTTLIWAPVAIFLFVTGHVWMGVALLVWANAAVVGVADYVLRPKLLGTKVKMNELLIFISLFGGIEAFGLLGTILGPIIAALLMSMFHIYLRDYRPRREPHGKPGPEAAAEG